MAVAATETRPADVGLKREMGLIGATWASETSIIGSGWLFGSYFAAQAIGSVAILCWIIAGIAVIFLALVHAELGGMYPVSGGTARFPHFAFGSIAGISFGFFSFLQAVTVAPIECYAVMQYGQYWFQSSSFTIFDTTTGKITTLGFILTIILMAIFTAINFLAMRLFNLVNSGITWWKVAIPVLAIIVLLTQFHSSNFSSGGGFIPTGVTWQKIFAAIPGAGIVFAYLGFEQADQLAGEIKNPQRNLPRAIMLAVGIGIAIYVLLQVAFIGAMDPKVLTAHGGFLGLACPPAPAHCSTAVSDIVAGPFAAVAALGGPAMYVLLLTGHEALYSRVVVIGLVLRVVALVVLAPRFGAIAAAFSWSACLIGTTIALNAVCRRYVGIDPSVITLLNPANALMTPVPASAAGRGGGLEP